RLDLVRRAGGLDHLLLRRLLRAHAELASHRRDVHPVRAQERLGDRGDAADLSRRGVPEKSRERGLLRHRYQLHAVLAESLTQLIRSSPLFATTWAGPRPKPGS